MILAQRRRIFLLALLLEACSPHDASAPPADQIIALLPDPPDGEAVAWSNWAGTFVQDYCVSCHMPSAPCTGSGCHSSDDSRLFDLRQKTAFTDHVSTIRCGIAKAQNPAWNCSVAPETFPKVSAEGNNPFPTDGERDFMLSWIDAGCP